MTLCDRCRRRVTNDEREFNTETATVCYRLTGAGRMHCQAAELRRLRRNAETLRKIALQVQNPTGSAQNHTALLAQLTQKALEP